MPSEEELKEEIKKRVINKWKGKWLIHKESKIWWEKMVKETINLTFEQRNTEVKQAINQLSKKHINFVDEICKKLTLQKLLQKLGLGGEK